MEWSEEQVVHLIELYETHPNLWNTRDPKYKKRNVKKDSIREIAEALNIETEEVERKLSVILAQYRRARGKASRMIKSGMGADEIKDQLWFGFKYFAFLHDKNEPNSEVRETSNKVNILLI